jgi:outer membrane protein
MAREGMPTAQSLGKLPRSFTHSMKPKFALLTALVAGLLPVAAFAQALPAAPQQAAPAASAAPAAPAAAPGAQAPVTIPPSAFPARVALIMFNDAVADTNEGQQAIAELQKKYQPKKDALDAQAAEVDSLKRALQAAPATLSEADKAAREKVIDTKNTAYQHQAEDASNAYNADIQEALGKVAEKFAAVMHKYVSDNGYTLLINVGDQQSPVIWASAEPNADITLAVIDAYNKSSGIAPPAPSAPAASRAKPAGTTTPRTNAPTKPATSTTPAKPAAK